MEGRKYKDETWERNKTLPLGWEGSHDCTEGRERQTNIPGTAWGKQISIALGFENERG